MTTRKPPIRCRRVPAAALVSLLLSTLSACSTSAPKQTAFQESLGVTVTSREIRIRTSDYAMVFAQTVELTADSILVLARERSVARNALIWKTYAVPAIYRSATLPDPLLAWIDSRVLTLQMKEYFLTGAGRELFGDHQALAVQAARFLERELDRDVELSEQEVDPELRAQVARFAADNPLQNPYFFRRSPVEQLAKAVGRDQVSGLQAVGSMAELLDDMSQRLNVYAELVPRSGRWQAELMLAELADPNRANIYLEILNQLEAMETFNEFLLATPELIEAEREAVLAAVDAQRVFFELSLERYLAEAREDVLDTIMREREAATGDVDRILSTRLGDAVTRLDGSISQAVVDIDGALVRAVDRLFVRLLQLVAIVGAASILLILLLRRRLAPARSE